MSLIFSRLDLEASGMWFPISLSALLVLFIPFMRKRQLTWTKIYATFGVVCSVTWIMDIIAAIYFDAFRYGSDHGIGLADLISISLIPSGLAIIYLNYRTKSNKWQMLILFTLLSLAIELATIHFQYFHLKYWKLYYSGIMYLIIYGLMLPLHKRFLEVGAS
jgi:zinc transporter ZupT